MTLATRRTLEQFAAHALASGIQQVEAAGSPLHPLLFDEEAKMYILFDAKGGVDPMQLALSAIKKNIQGIQRCALVIDSRITGDDGKRWDAILVMACERDADEGIVMGQRYVPKGWFRKFRTQGGQEQVGACRNFIREALAG